MSRLSKDRLIYVNKLKKLNNDAATMTITYANLDPETVQFMKNRTHEAFEKYLHDPKRTEEEVAYVKALDRSNMITGFTVEYEKMGQFASHFREVIQLVLIDRAQQLYFEVLQNGQNDVVAY